MTQYLWLATVVFLGSLFTTFAIWSRFPGRYRALTLLAWLALIPTTYAYSQAFLGLPDPAEIKGDVHIYSGVIVPNVAIYLWVDDGGGVPHYYKLPYSEEQASELQKAMDDKNANKGGAVMMKSNEYNPGKPVFYNEPVTESAPKVAE